MVVKPRRVMFAKSAVLSDACNKRTGQDRTGVELDYDYEYEFFVSSRSSSLVWDGLHARVRIAWRTVLHVCFSRLLRLVVLGVAVSLISIIIVVVVVVVVLSIS